MCVRVYVCFSLFLYCFVHVFFPFCFVSCLFPPLIFFLLYIFALPFGCSDCHKTYIVDELETIANIKCKKQQQQRQTSTVTLSMRKGSHIKQKSVRA